MIMKIKYIQSTKDTFAWVAPRLLKISKYPFTKNQLIGHQNPPLPMILNLKPFQLKHTLGSFMGYWVVNYTGFIKTLGTCHD